MSIFFNFRDFYIGNIIVKYLIKKFKVASLYTTIKILNYGNYEIK